MKIGIVGNGMIVGMFLRDALLIEEAEIISLCVRPHSYEKGQKIALEHNIPLIETDYEAFLSTDTLLILGLGLVAFVFDTVGGVFFAKFLNLFSKKKVNPMIGAAGMSAFPMSARVIHKMGLEEDNQNFLLMHAVGANVSGQIASVIAGGLMLGLIK